MYSKRNFTLCLLLSFLLAFGMGNGAAASGFPENGPSGGPGSDFKSMPDSSVVLTGCASTDATPPVAVCQDITVYLDAAGSATVKGADLDNGSTDNCGIKNFLINNSDSITVGCNDLTPFTVTVAVLDSNNLPALCSPNRTVTVLDTISPNALCQDVTVNLDANGDASTGVASIDDGSTDACGIASRQLDDSTFTCADLGNVSVIMTVTDDNGNSRACTTTVTVEDNIAPTASCLDITVQLGTDKTETILSSDLDDGSSDNCGTVTFSAAQTTFTCADEGNNNSVVLTVSDPSGNTSTCTANVDVEALFSNSSTTCPSGPVDVYLGASGSLTLVPGDLVDFINGCHIASATVAPTSVNCISANPTTVTVNYTRTNNNTGFCIFNLNINDTIRPQAACQDITVQLNGSGTANTSIGAVNNGSTDNCSVSNFSFASGSYSCSDFPSVVDSLFATDAGSNVGTCAFTVTIEDVTPPTASCQDITVFIDGAGSAVLVGANIDDGSTDNCGNLTFTTSPLSYDCSQLGSNTTTLTVTDIGGNTATCTATVTVEDNTAPTASCQDITVQLDTNGTVTIATDDVDDGSSDNCGTSFSINNNTFSCSDIGSNTVTLTVTDPSSNSNTCTSNVTVEDDLPPTAVCGSVTVYLDNQGDATLVPADLDDGSTDNCDTPTFSLASPDVDCNDVGTITVSLQVSDNSANTSSCNASVTVLDTIPPSAVCQGTTIFLDASGQATLSPASIDGGSTDECTIASRSVLTTTFECSDFGVNNVQLKVFDPSGNSDTCTAQVTVSDNIAPVANCQDVTVSLNISGSYVVHDSIIDASSTDNCSFTYSTGTTTLGCADIGANSVTLTITDIGGNTASCTQTLTLQDAGSGSASCQNITIDLAQNGTATIVPADLDGGSSAVCGIDTSYISQSTFNCTNIGANSVTLTIEDLSNNTSSCTSTVTVQDVLPPINICASGVTASLNTDGFATITPGPFSQVLNDNCTSGGNITLALDRDTLFCGDLGSASVILSATDLFGNTSTCTATITVNDPVNPVASCKNDTVFLDQAGIALVTAADLDNGSTDNCSIGTLSASPDTLFCNDLGTNSVTLTVMDPAGNTHTCTSTVTVVDTFPLTTICKDTTLYLDASGLITVTQAAIDDGSFDNCALKSNSISPQTIDCSQVNTVVTATLTLTDSSDNASSCTSLITVEDTTKPVMVCANPTIYLNQAGTATLAVAQVDGGTADNCSVSSLTIDISTFDCADIGTNAVVLTATDQSGMVDTCISTVTLLDTVKPIPSCQSITVHLDTAGQGSFVTANIENGSTDNCLLDTLFLSSYTVNCSNLGSNTITLTAVDSSLNSASCQATVTVIDTVKPIVVCDTSDISIGQNGFVTYTAADADAGSTDNCTIANLGFSTTTFSCTDLGQTVNLPLVVTDQSGNSRACQAVVTIVDTVAPVVLCQNLTVALDSGGSVRISVPDINRGSSDNCFLTNLVLSDSTFDCSQLGANTIVLTGTDQSGVVGTCTSTVFVEDTIFPSATCIDITVYLSDSGATNITTSQVSQAAVDNCSIDTIAVSQSFFDCSDLGPNNVLLEVSDPSGNITPCGVVITVEDSTKPKMFCDTIVPLIGSSGQLTVTINDIDLGSTDNCGISNISFTPVTFTCADVSQSFQMPLTATDSSGNSQTCIGLVTVGDSFPPVATCQNLTIFLDNTGFAVVPPSALGSATDNCTFTESISQDSFTCSSTGTNVIVYSATDQFGLVGSCNSLVTIFDTIQPTVACLDDTVYLDSTGFTFVPSRNIIDLPGDICGTISLFFGDTTFNCQEVGINTVGVFLVDSSGNVGACYSDVLVRDTIGPVAVCQPFDIYLGPSGTAVVTPAMVDGGSTDNCAITLRQLSLDTVRCSDIGLLTASMEVFDQNGFTDNCSANVEVIDTLPPTAICSNQTITLDSTGNITLGFADVDGGSFDNCGISSIVFSTTNYGCGDVGSQLVALTVTDLSGNSGTCNSTVTVVDSVPPVAVCQALTVFLDSLGQASITPQDMSAGSSDNCSINQETISSSDFLCGNVGSNNVTYTVADAQGNTDTCTQTVTVIDTISPIAACLSDTLYLDSLGLCSTSLADLDGGASDNCAIVQRTLSDSTFDCQDIGLSTLTLSFADAAGNSSSCTSSILVIDTIHPAAACQDTMFFLDGTGSASLGFAAIDSGSTDNCGIDSFAISTTTFLCGDVGTNSVTLTIFDPSGNSSSCTSAIQIMDTIAPTAVCNNLTVFLDAAGTGSINLADVDGGSADNCGLDTSFVDIQDFNCADVGTVAVTLTATDQSALSSTCTSTVTVLDTISPTVACLNVSVYLDQTATATITLSDVEGPSSDNCGLQGSTVSQTNFTAADLGSNPVTVTVTDLSGNTGSCLATVTVLDTLVAAGDPQLWTGQLDVWPNPSFGAFQVRLFGADQLYGEKVDLEITDISGKVLLKTREKYRLDGLETSFDLSSYSKGVYVLRIKAKSTTLSRRLVKN